MTDLTLTALAEIAGKPLTTCNSWLEQGMKSRKSGRNRVVTTSDAIRFLAAREAQPGSQRERLAMEQADKVALQNARERGKLIYADQVGDTLNSLAAHLAAQLDALPGRLANELAGITDAAIIRARLLEEARAIRASAAKHMGGIADAAEKVAR